MLPATSKGDALMAGMGKQRLPSVPSKGPHFLAQGFLLGVSLPGTPSSPMRPPPLPILGILL